MVRFVPLLVLFLMIAAAKAAPFDELSFDETGSEGLPLIHGAKRPRIIGGNTVSRGQVPWQAALYTNVNGKNTFVCGGVLISPKWVLTAANCVDYLRDVTVHLGITSLQSTNERVTVNVGRIEIHPGWNRWDLANANDIALLELTSSVPLSTNIQPIPLTTYTLSSNVRVTASGWGTTSDASKALSQNLKQVSLTTITNEVCSSKYESLPLGEGIVCARGESVESTCNGDSGGPLVVRYGANVALVGIASFNKPGKCAMEYPAGFIRTAYHGWWIYYVSNVK